MLAASLHGAIAEVLPMRLEFYEHWLRPEVLHLGVVGRAPLAAVLGFLRAEGAYDRVVARGGMVAADWALYGESEATMRMAQLIPLALGARLALRAACRLVRETTDGGEVRVVVRGHAAEITIARSVFCSVREPAPRPLCDYYAAAVTRVLQRYGVDGQARAERCRAVGDPQCALSVQMSGRARPSGEGRP